MVKEVTVDGAHNESVGAGFIPSKEVTEFRNYVDSGRQDIVSWHYRMMRTGQTVEYVKRMHEKYSFADGKYRKKMTIREAFELLNVFIDSSDPDLSLPNAVHAFQTAEGIRQDGLPDWLQLVGLLHDMGKIMFGLGGVKEDGQHGTPEEPQWGLGGDTFVVGCAIPDCAVFPEYNCLNPDSKDPRYNTELGMYEAHCGLDKLLFAYGHDEYMYQMLIANGCTIPKAGLDMIRFHSAYPWHQGGAYRQFMTPEDEKTLEWVKQFNKYDLYTKDEHGVQGSVEELMAYYDTLIDKYFPEKVLRW